MRKFAVFSAMIFCSIIVAGLYGVVHDQITYSISPEYFTKFKYQQFGLDPEWFGGHRQTVAVIGFLATWWTGMLIGIVLALTGLIFRDHRLMAGALRKAILIVIVFSSGFAVIGGLYGYFYLASSGVDWYLPPDLIHRTALITVGSIHNFSYLGGFFGMIAGVYYLVRRNKMERGGTDIV